MSNPYLNKLRSLPRIEKLNNLYKAVSLFSGGGGLDLGLELSGFKASFASDIAEYHCETISYNISHCITEVKDAKDLTGEGIRSLTSQDSFDLVSGGPPCQAFSILGQRNSFHDPRGQLVFEFVRLVKELQPRAFIFENVPGLLTLNSGEDWKALLHYFQSETHYRIYDAILNSADFGIPQIRKRVFIVGFEMRDAVFNFPEPTHRDTNGKLGLFDRHLPGWLPSRLALEDIDALPNHRLRPHGQRVRNRYQNVPPGGRDKVDHTDRIDPDKPSGTVLVGSKAGGGRPFIHPYEPRHLTVREAARLQSFPDWYVFQGPETWQYRAVGNAVPPLIAKALGEAIRRTLESLESSL